MASQRNPASLGLVPRFSEATGRGTYVADGCSIAHGTRVAAYWDDLTFHPAPSSLYTLELPPMLCYSSPFQPY